MNQAITIIKRKIEELGNELAHDDRYPASANPLFREKKEAGIIRAITELGEVLKAMNEA